MCSRTVEILAAPHVYRTTTKAAVHHAKKLTFFNVEKPNEPKKFSDVKTKRVKYLLGLKLLMRLFLKFDYQQIA